jgi:sensor histidine kinase YesM
MRKYKHPNEVYENNWIAFWGIPVIAALMPLLFLEQALKDGMSYGHLYVQAFCFTSLIWLFNILSARYVNKQFGAPEQRKLRLVWLVLGAIVATLSASIIVRLLIPIVDPFFNPLCMKNQIGQTLGSWLMVALVLLTYETKRNAILYQNAMTEKSELEKAHSIHILESLKSQVNPHFLFNSLNTLVSLIREDGTKAEEFTRRLSSVYRNILDCQHEYLCPLEDEIKLADHYSWLLQARFGDHLVIEQDCAPKFAQNRFLPPLTLQLLLENAVKHNIASARQPLTIQVTCTSEHITVRNNLQPKLQVTRGAELGLTNLIARYGYLTDQKIQVDKTETEFRVTLPLLQIQKIAV